MKNYYFPLVLSALPMIFLYACQTDLPEAGELKSPVAFGFSVPTGNESSRVLSNDFSFVVKAQITISKADSSTKVFRKKELKVYESDGVLFAEEVFLPIGNYLITELLLLSEEGVAIFAIPEKGKLQDHIDKQLPLPFSVEGNNSTKTVTLEVLSTLGFTPEEFGFDPAEVAFEEAEFFKVMLVEKGNPQNILNGTLRLKTADTTVSFEIDSIAKVLLKEEYKYDQRSYLEASAPGYLALNASVGRDSLLQHYDDPLVLELEKIKESYPFSIGLAAFHVRDLQGTRANSLEEVVKARITLYQSGAELEDHQDVEVVVFEEEGNYYLEAMDLPIGDYTIQALYLQNAEDRTIFAVPHVGCYLEKYYQYTLPPQFSISGDPKSHTRFFRVMDTSGFLPSEFGFDPDRISFKAQVLPFYVTLQERGAAGKYLTGTLTSGTNGKVQKEVNHLTRVNLFEGDYQNDGVFIKVQAEGYEEFRYTYTKDSLMKHHEENPLIIELDIRPLVVDGVYRGNVLLETQAEVDEFAKWHCTTIIGNLTIKGQRGAEDQITDLAGLQSLTEVGGMVSISDCDNLSNLKGLEYLSSINGGRLEIARNNSLQNLKGLSGLTILNELTISENASLVNLEGLENLKEVGGMVLESNPLLNALKGLDNVERMKSLRIDDSESLVDFHGFDTSISSLGTFVSINNHNLESLRGLILPSCKIDGGVEITDNWSLESLAGLDFSQHVAFSVSLEYNSELKDISAMAAIKTIGRKLTIETCHRLTSLNGLENLISVGTANSSESLEIFDNKKLVDFCALTSLFTEGDVFGYDIQLNAYNPTEADMKTGKCVLRD